MPFTASDLADYAACRSEYDRRSSIINRLRGKARSSATQSLRRDMAAMSAGAPFERVRISADGLSVAL